MNNTDVIKQILYSYEAAEFIECDPVKVLSFLSDDVIGIGIGDQGIISSKKEIAKIMMATIKKDMKVSCTLDYENVVIHFTDRHSANLCAKVIVQRTENDQTTTRAFLQSFNLRVENGDWHICQLHVSPITILPESIEAYPIAFADNTSGNLYSQITTEAFNLMSASFAGGVVGVRQVGDQYPLYFANDGIARFLGYTVEEFHEVFREDVAKIFYAGDIEYVMKLTDDVLLRNIDCTERLRLQKKDGSLLPVIDYARRSHDNEGNDILIAVFTDISELVDLHEKLEKQNADILSSIRYASKIQRDLLSPNARFAEAFSDYSVLWMPRDIVGGDIYWIKNFVEGTVLAVCDCTGHGTPGALLTMLVSSTFDNMVNEENCQDIAQLMLDLDRKISMVLNVHIKEQDENQNITHIHDGCDIAILFIGKDGTVTLSSAGLHVFVCDGKEINHIKGQRLYIGDGRLTDKKEITATNIPPNANHKFYIASDGLYDQIGGELSLPFGYRRFEEIILQNHTEKQAVISEKIWNAFESYRGEHIRRDDMELITFKP